MSDRAKLYTEAFDEIAKLRAEIAALKHNLEVVRENHRSLELHCSNRESLLQSLIGLRNEQTTEIAALREQIKALEGLISGAIQHSWTPEDYDKFWLAVGKWRKP